MRTIRLIYWLMAIGSFFLATGGPAFSAPMTGARGDFQNILNSDEAFSGLNAVTDRWESADGAFGEMSGHMTFTVIAESPRFKNKNSFGVFSGETFIEIFDGRKGVGDTVVVDMDAIRTQLGSDTFGFYLSRPYGKFGNTFFSDPALNFKGLDHLAVYGGIGKEVLLGFEDLARGKGRHSNHFAVKISAPHGDAAPAPVPEPATLLLLGSGLVGLVAARKRQK